MGDEQDDAGPDPLAVANRLASLPERAMRMVRLGEMLVATKPVTAAWLLDALATAGRAGGPPYAVALLAAVDLFTEGRLEPDIRTAIHAAAEEHGLRACCELLLDADGTAADGLTKPRALGPDARPLTLGERKSLARSWRRDVLERLLTDPHHDVVALLLGNPHVTQDDVLRIATARRSSALVLDQILRSSKWSVDGRVRCAVVRNPNLPVAVALRLLGLLTQAEIREIAQDPHLPDALRASLDRRLRPPI